MNKLLTDDEVAERINMSKKRLQNLRGEQRGLDMDQIPAWVEVGNSWRPRVLGTRESEVNAWLDRHTRGKVA